MWQDSHMAPKRPRDPNQLAKAIVDIATGDLPDPVSEQKRSPAQRGRAGGLTGGRVRAEHLSEQQRAEIARRAANARWKKPH